MSFSLYLVIAVRSLQLATEIQHVQVQAAAPAEFTALLALRAEAGELSASDERKLRSLQRATEREVLQVLPACRAHAPAGVKVVTHCSNASPGSQHQSMYDHEVVIVWSLRLLGCRQRM